MYKSYSLYETRSSSQLFSEAFGNSKTCECSFAKNSTMYRVFILIKLVIMALPQQNKKTARHIWSPPHLGSSLAEQKTCSGLQTYHAFSAPFFLTSLTTEKSNSILGVRKTSKQNSNKLTQFIYMPKLLTSSLPR